MRTVYIIRHGEIINFDGKKRCIGRTDIPLSERGKSQAVQLASFFDNKKPTAVYTSPLERARITAEILSCGRWPIKVCSPLTELDMGAWEGLSFSEIRDIYPELYQKRGENPESVSPPNGETLATASDRISAAFYQILLKSTGDIVLVAHSGVIRILICMLKGLPLKAWLTLPQPYGCINMVRIAGNNIMTDEVGIMPRDAPTDSECFDMLSEKETPQAVTDHCRMVAVKADEIASVLIRQGNFINKGIVRAGSMLHDIARVYPHHSKIGATWITEAGYPRVAKVIAEHELLPEPVCFDESAVVCLADKMILGTQEVTLEERFAHSRKRCNDETACRNHEVRACQAFFLRDTIFPSCPI